MHARLRTRQGLPFLLDSFHTLLHLDAPSPQLPPRADPLPVAALDLDVQFVLGGKTLPWTRNRFPEGTSSREIKIESLAGLKFDQTLIEAKAGEALRIRFRNDDPLMPHNLVFVEEGAAVEVGNASNMMLTDTAAAAKRHYVPESDKVLFHTSVLVHNRQQILYVHAPKTPGDYPYLCTFPGHWGVMRGILQVSE